MLLLYLKSFGPSSHIIRITPSNSGSVLVKVTGPYTKLLIKRQNLLIIYSSFYTRCHETSVKKVNVTIYQIDGKWCSRYQISKEANSLTYLTVMTILLNHHTLLLYIKKKAWLKIFGHSNSLYTRASRIITNHTLIGEYRLRFFSRKEFKYSYRSYPIESRWHILYEYKRFNGYWNLWKDSISHFVMFLELNPSTFTFVE